MPVKKQSSKVADAISSLQLTIDAVEKDIKEILLKRNFSFIDVVKVFIITEIRIVRAVSDLSGLRERERHKVVITVIEDLYWKYNPNIPGIPEPFESIIERILLKVIVPVMYDVGRMIIKGLV